MAMWRSVILAPLTPLLFSVILTYLLLMVLLLEVTGLHQMGIESVFQAVMMFQDLKEPEVQC